MERVMGRVRSLDAYPKINEDFYSRTLSGGVITLAFTAIMILLFISELRLYLNSVTETHLVVDAGRGETLWINFDDTFPALACSIVSVDSMDVSSQQHFDVKHDIIKKRIDAHGNVIEIVVRAMVQKRRMIIAATLAKKYKKHTERKSGQSLIQN